MAFCPKRNSLNSLRLILATVVAIAHVGAIAYGNQPRIGVTDVGALAVDAFFVLSGFLITSSFLRLGSVGRYLWHRALRILPAFWCVLLLISFGVAPLLALLEGRPPSSVFTGDNPSWLFALNNIFLMMRQFDVAGLPTGTDNPQVVNGALWTLYFEFVCYVLVVVLGVMRILASRGLVVALTALSGLALGLQELGWAPDIADLYLRFVFMFLLGVLGHLYADRLVIRGNYALLAASVTLVSLLLFTDYRPAGGAAFAYLCLWAAVSTPWLAPGPTTDLSYGMYIYHWPIITLLTTAGVAAALPMWAFGTLALLLSAGVAFCSWRLVERPALGWKDAALPGLSRRRRPGRVAPLPNS